MPYVVSESEFWWTVDLPDCGRRPPPPDDDPPPPDPDDTIGRSNSSTALGGDDDPLLPLKMAEACGIKTAPAATLDNFLLAPAAAPRGKTTCARCAFMMNPVVR